MPQHTSRPITTMPSTLQGSHVLGEKCLNALSMLHCSIYRECTINSAEGCNHYIILSIRGRLLVRACGSLPFISQCQPDSVIQTWNSGDMSAFAAWSCRCAQSSTVRRCRRRCRARFKHMSWHHPATCQHAASLSKLQGNMLNMAACSHEKNILTPGHNTVACKMGIFLSLENFPASVPRSQENIAPTI